MVPPPYIQEAVHTLPLSGRGAWRQHRPEQKNEREEDQAVTHHWQRAEEPAGSIGDASIARLVPDEGLDERFERSDHAGLRLELAFQNHRAEDGIDESQRQPACQHGQPPPNPRGVRVGREMMAEPPQAERDPRRERGRLEVEVLDQVEQDARSEHRHRQTVGNSLSTRDSTREQQQHEPSQDCARAAAQHDALRYQAAEELAPRLELDQQRADDVDDCADDQQAGEKPPHLPALRAGLLAHDGYNGTCSSESTTGSGYELTK